MQKYGAIQWIQYLRQMIENKKLPEFFIREELIATCKKVGHIEELREELQNKLNRSVVKRAVNVKVEPHERLLGKQTMVYS